MSKPQAAAGCRRLKKKNPWREIAKAKEPNNQESKMTMTSRSPRQLKAHEKQKAQMINTRIHIETSVFNQHYEWLAFASRTHCKQATSASTQRPSDLATTVEVSLSAGVGKSKPMDPQRPVVGDRLDRLDLRRRIPETLKSHFRGLERVRV